MRKNLILLLVAFSCYSCTSVKNTSNAVQWSAFLEQHDLTWDTIPTNYYAGAILGNGHIGTNFYADKSANTYRWDIGRVDINEYRSGTNILFDKARLPLGYFSLTTQGKVKEENMRLSIYNALASGTLQTTSGSIDFTTYTHALENVIRIELTTHEDEAIKEWKWNPDKARSPRASLPQGRHITLQEYPENPPVKSLEKDGFSFSIQQLLSGKCYVVAWRIWPHGHNKIVDITVALADNEEQAIQEAKDTLNKFTSKSPSKRYKEHKMWWNDYYPTSYASFADAKTENFYWTQMYKLACLTRPDKFVIDLQGPWTNTTPWPATWWNLNVQLTYSPLFTGNRLDFSEPLWKALNENLENLINNVPVEEWRVDAAGIGRSSSLDLVSPIRMDLVKENKYEVGNLTWVLYYYYQYCMYKPDNKELTEKFYPLLKRSIAFYEHILYEGEDGLLHLPVTASPEYKEAPDCNYDLALLRWGLQTLLTINADYQLDDSKVADWQKIQHRLVDYPMDEDGFLIGDGVKLTYSHRHYSHLMMIYPLQLVNWDDESQRDLITRSIDHWLGMPGYHQGYTFTGAASMYALQGNGDKAFDCLKQLLDRFIQPNTLYKEAGPVIETPFSAITSLQELYLQSSAQDIRVFPAVPSSWKEACFLNWKAYGGYTVSAIREESETKFIEIRAAVDGKVEIMCNMDLDQSICKNAKGDVIEPLITNRGTVELHLQEGDVVQFVRKGYQKPVDLTHLHPADANHYGFKIK